MLRKSAGSKVGKEGQVRPSECRDRPELPRPTIELCNGNRKSRVTHRVCIPHDGICGEDDTCEPECDGLGVVHRCCDEDLAAESRRVLYMRTSRGSEETPFRTRRR